MHKYSDIVKMSERLHFASRLFEFKMCTVLRQYGRQSAVCNVNIGRH